MYSALLVDFYRNSFSLPLCTRYGSLREVPAYPKFIQEKFERCLDLYLCPRQRKMRVCIFHVNPISILGWIHSHSRFKLILKTWFQSCHAPVTFIHSLLHKPLYESTVVICWSQCVSENSSVYPNWLQVYKGHSDLVRCISVEPLGQWLASGPSLAHVQCCICVDMHMVMFQAVMTVLSVFGRSPPDGVWTPSSFQLNLSLSHSLPTSPTLSCPLLCKNHKLHLTRKACCDRCPLSLHFLW